MTLKLPPYPAECIQINFITEETEVEKYAKLQNEQFLPFAASGIINSTILSAKYLTMGNDVKKVIEICVNVEAEELFYQPGYTFAFQPQNCEKEVNKIIERLRYNLFADNIFHLSVKESETKKKYKLPSHIPVIGTIRQILLNNLDIRAIPKKLFLRALSKYTSKKEELQTLDEICSLSSGSKYSDFISQEYMPLFEVLKKFPSAFPPFSVLLEHLPRLHPRPYSVTSSPLSFTPTNSGVKFIFSVTELPKNYLGVTSGWLNKLVEKHLQETEIDIKIPMYLRKPNKFILPEDNSKNILMICNGVGLAPFLGFLEHRRVEIGNGDNGGKMWLFYGCRYSDRDFLHKKEIKEYLDKSILTKLFATFSREGTNEKYVQHMIKKNSIEFVEMLEDNTVVYVCGGKKMSEDVFEAIVDCVKEVKKYETEEAVNFVRMLQNTNVYIEDIWT